MANQNYKDIVSEYAKRNNIKLVEYEGKIIDITEYLYAYPDISENEIDLSEDNDYFAIYDSYEQFFNENEEYFEEDKDLDKEEFYKTICQKYIKTMEKEMLFEKEDGSILRIFVKDEYIDLKNKITLENYKIFLENDFPVLGYNSYEELYENDLKYRILTDIEELGLMSDGENWDFYLSPEEIDKLAFGGSERNELTKNFLKEEIEKYCDKEGNIIPNSSEREIAKELNLGNIIIEENIKTKEDFEEYIENNLFNSIYDEFKREVLEDFDDYLNEYFEEFEETNFADNIKEYYKMEVENNFWDIIEDDTGYGGNIAFDINYTLENTGVKVNLLLATDVEKDLEFSSIEKTFKGKVEDKTEMEYVVDNSLTYLISQQGYKVEDIISSYNENPEGFPPTDYKLPFIESVVDELANLPDYKYSQTVILQELNGKELLDLIENKEYNIESKITISKDSMVGLYDSINGSGSLLEINLDKDFSFPLSMVDKIEFENLSYENREEQNRTVGYSINEVYGLIGDCWEKDSFKMKEKAFEFKYIPENINEILKIKQESYEKTVYKLRSSF